MSFSVRPQVQLVHSVDKLLIRRSRVGELGQNLPKLRGITIYEPQGVLLHFFFINYLGSCEMELEVFEEAA